MKECSLYRTYFAENLLFLLKINCFILFYVHYIIQMCSLYGTYIVVIMNETKSQEG